MTNALATRDSMARYANTLLNVASTLAEAGDGKPILTLDKDTGEWKYGQNNERLDPISVLAVDPINIRHGWIAFKRVGTGLADCVDGTVANILQPITQPLMDISELPELETEKRGREEPVRPSWQFQITIDMRVVEGPNTGADVSFRPTSRGGLAMCRKLLEEIARRLTGNTPDLCVPLIELFSGSYQHKKYGTIYTPDHAILDWMGLDETEVPETAGSDHPYEDVETETAPSPAPAAAAGVQNPARSRREAPPAAAAAQPAPRPRGRPRLNTAETPAAAAPAAPVAPEGGIRGRAAARGARNVQA